VVSAIEEAEVVLDVRCSAGTYVRSLARDLGESLGLGGHLTALRRTESGGFGIGDAVTLEELERSTWDRTLPLRSLLGDLPAVLVGREGRDALVQGRDLTRRLVLEGFPEEPPERVRVLDGEGDLLGLAIPRGFGEPAPGLPQESVLHPDVVFAAPR
jgi:tRNA pseudouridine55 synthase